MDPRLDPPHILGLRRASALAVGLALVAATGCSKEAEFDAAEALALTRIDALSALAAAREAERGWPMELELEVQDGKAVYSVELRTGDGVATVRVDGQTGAATSSGRVELTEKEQYTLARLDEVEKGRRRSMGKAMRLAMDKTAGAAPFEVDLKLREDRPVFVVQLAGSGREEIVEVPVESDEAEPTETGGDQAGGVEAGGAGPG